MCCWTIHFDKLVASSALQRLDLGYTVLDAMNWPGSCRTAAPPSLSQRAVSVDEVDRLLESESLQGYVLLESMMLQSSESSR
ncbi:hypothetical protein [Paenibacillus larvae]|uniref:hypothetical protein n=1 Tax=Paenibacillus larvae TaxID=1464 RepID=UPI00288E14DD|nr:hypothetical protein [Paenibacillus larvae]MDT2194477.1 hypothetical protein [Paenibacillus larvae]